MPTVIEAEMAVRKRVEGVRAAAQVGDMDGARYLQLALCWDVLRVFALEFGPLQGVAQAALRSDEHTGYFGTVTP